MAFRTDVLTFLSELVVGLGAPLTDSGRINVDVLSTLGNLAGKGTDAEAELFMEGRLGKTGDRGVAGRHLLSVRGDGLLCIWDSEGTTDRERGLPKLSCIPGVYGVRGPAAGEATLGDEPMGVTIDLCDDDPKLVLMQGPLLEAVVPVEGILIEAPFEGVLSEQPREPVENLMEEARGSVAEPTTRGDAALMFACGVLLCQLPYDDAALIMTDMTQLADGCGSARSSTRLKKKQLEPAIT
jgi:hypothetical protein